MRKLKRFNLHNVQLLSNNDLQNLVGGSNGAAICHTSASCKFYVAELKEYVYGTCQEYQYGSAFYCECVGNNLKGASSDCMQVV